MKHMLFDAGEAVLLTEHGVETGNGRCDLIYPQLRFLHPEAVLGSISIDPEFMTLENYILLPVCHEYRT